MKDRFKRILKYVISIIVSISLAFSAFGADKMRVCSRRREDNIERQKVEN